MTAELLTTSRPGRRPRRPRALDAAAVVARREADIALLVAAAEWAEANPPAEGVAYPGWGEPDLLRRERVTPMGGPGAGLVAEFAPIELAATLGWSHEAAPELISDAVELTRRLPRLFDLVLAHRLSVRLAREAAQHTRDLCADAARAADRMLAWDPAQLDPARIRRLVDEIRSWFDPDRAVADEEVALARRRVELGTGSAPATTEMLMTLDTADADPLRRSRPTLPAPPPTHVPPRRPTTPRRP